MGGARDEQVHATQPDAALVQELNAALSLPPGDWKALTGGRSNRVWRSGDVVLKQILPDTGTPLFPNDPRSEVAALKALPPFLVPQLLAEGVGWFAYAHVPGRAWTHDPGPVARLFAKVHATPAPEGMRVLPMGGQAIAEHARGFGAAGLPECPSIDDPGPTSRLLVHGDPVPANIVVTPDGLRLIDWQCPGLGDPVDDLALFLSPAMQFLYRGRPLTEGEGAAFLAAYPNRETVARYLRLAPVLGWRIAAHCALRAARGDQGYAEALGLQLTQGLLSIRIPV
jgi:hypothetical protein